jgi:hypothetical protein
MSQLDANKLAVEITNNQIVPDEGPKALPVILDFSVVDTYDLDLSNLQQRGWFSMLQTIFVDTKDAGGGVLTITISGSGQQLVIPSGRQGYYSVLVPNPAKLTFFCATAALLKVFLLNVAVPGHDWSVI